MLNKLQKYYDLIIQEYNEGDIYFFIGLVANILLIVSLIPIVIHIVNINSTYQYPLSSLLIKIVVVIMWIIYGFGRGSEMIILRSVILLLYFLFFIYMKFIKGV